MPSPKAAWFLALLLSAPALAHAAPKKAHSVALGSPRRVPYSLQGDPAGAAKDETSLLVRPLVVDGLVKDWTTGDPHSVTERSFAVRRALRLNDALPTDRDARWVWQRGPWLLIDRTTGRITSLHLPDYDPAVSAIVWFRDYAAYCGLNSTGKQLLAVVAQIEARRPLLAKKLQLWNPADHPSPACAPALWQRDPLKVTFQPTGATPVDFDLVGASAILVEEGDTDEP
jgi:hypothetical protein